MHDHRIVGNLQQLDGARAVTRIAGGDFALHLLNIERRTVVARALPLAKRRLARSSTEASRYIFSVACRITGRGIAAFNVATARAPTMACCAATKCATAVVSHPPNLSRDRRRTNADSPAPDHWLVPDSSKSMVAGTPPVPHRQLALTPGLGDQHRGGAIHRPGVQQSAERCATSRVTVLLPVWLA